MFIWFLINTLHYNQMERKNVEILVHLTFKYYTQPEILLGQNKPRNGQCRVVKQCKKVPC